MLSCEAIANQALQHTPMSVRLGSMGLIQRLRRSISLEKKQDVGHLAMQ